MQRFKMGSLVVLVLALTACGDSVSASGELGAMTFSLAANYELEGSLTEIGIVTGHEQDIVTGLTRRGERRVDHANQVTYRLLPSAGTEVSVDSRLDDDDVPWVKVLVDEPGTYMLEALEDDEIVDYLTLEFRRPESIDVVSWIKAPGEDDFGRDLRRDSYGVVEGAQVVMVPIPMGPDNERLAGDYDVAFSFTPEWAAVHTSNVAGIYEKEGVFGGAVNESLVFTEPADVEVFVEDLPNDLVEVIDVEVTERPQE